MAKRYNISTPKAYRDKQGVEKTAWNNVGVLVKFDAIADKPEGFTIELNMFPNQKFGVFEETPRVVKDTPAKNNNTSPDPTTGEEINPEDIPF